MKLTEGELFNIRYTKTGTDEVTDRTVIPTTVPQHIKALDVTDLSLTDQEVMQAQYQEYRQYIAGVFDRTFTFEDWLAHTTGESSSVKWRTFKSEQTEVICSEEANL